MVRTWFGRNLNNSRYYFDRAEAMLIGKETAIDRYSDFSRAEKHMEKHLDKYSLKKDKSPVAEKALEREVLKCRRKKYLEEWRLKDYYGVSSADFEAMLPDPTRVWKRGLYAAIVSLALIGSAAAVYGIKSARDWLQVRDHYNEGKTLLMPKIDKALRTEKIKDVDDLYKRLSEARYETPRRDFRDFWDETDRLGDNIRNLKKLMRAREEIVEAEKMANRNNSAGALRLLEGLDGATSLLGAVEAESLPEHSREEFGKLASKVSELSEKCSQYKSDSNKFNPIKEDIAKLNDKIISLDGILKSGELFDVDKTKTIINSVNKYLIDLESVNPDAVGGKKAIDEVKRELNKIRDLVEGKNGLLTSHELIEFDKVKALFGQLRTAIISMDYYLDDNVASGLTRLNALLEKAKNDLRSIDSGRVDTYQAIRELSSLEIEVGNVGKEATRVVKLKETAKGKDADAKVSAASELVKRYFDKNFREKKWDSILEYLAFVPEPRSGVVENIANIVDLETKLTKPDGQIFVKDSGLTKDDLDSYIIEIDVYNDNKDEDKAKTTVQTLLKEADLEEGKNALSAIDALIKLRGEKNTLEKSAVKSDYNINRTKRLEALPSEIQSAEGNVKNTLIKFREAAKAYLESGDKIPDLRLMTALANSYSNLGKTDIANELNAKVAELKKKYKVE